MLAIPSTDIASSSVKSPIPASKSPMRKRSRTITGVVYDEEGNPVIGASVMNKETAQGAITDLDGNFTLSVPEDATSWN